MIKQNLKTNLTILLSFLFFLTYSNTISAQKSSTNQSKHFPAFSWETVPVAFHFGKNSGLMTEAEAKFVAAKSNFICLEKGHALGQFESTEEGIEQEARQLKKYNPNMKVIFYWNTFLDYPLFEAHQTYQEHPEWWLKTKDGELDLKNGHLKRYDLSNPKVRNWWTDVAQKAVLEGSTDGVFMDAFPQIKATRNRELWGDKKYKAMQKGLKKVIKETRKKLGRDQLLVYNGIRSTPQLQIGDEHRKSTDAVMIEHFGHFNSGTKESMLLDIQEMEKSAKSGKIVVFKAWPTFAWIDKEAMAKPLEEKRAIAKANIEFPLAAFLVGAQENCYFIYNWGYRMEMGGLEWYPELDKKLGRPLADATQSGWTFSRNFEYASVWVDLETKESKIDWKK